MVDTTGTGGNSVIYNATENTMRVFFTNPNSTSNFQQNEKIRIAGNFDNAQELANSTMINGREFTINNVTSNFIEINTTGLDFPDDNFSLAETDLFVMSDESEDVEAFFEGGTNVFDGSTAHFGSNKIVLRETFKHSYKNTDVINESRGYKGGAAAEVTSATTLASDTLKVTVDGGTQVTVTVDNITSLTSNVAIATALESEINAAFLHYGPFNETKKEFYSK